MAKSITENELECRLCGHKWKKRTDKTPVACPNCKRYDWQITNWRTETPTKSDIYGQVE